MRTIFMGTPDFARKSLQHLYDSKYDITAVFTGKDKPRGRGMKMMPSPVKELALRYGTPIYYPDNLTADFVSGLKCDIIAVVAFGKILKREILDIPPLGCINIHGSILPKYRGAAPIQHAIMNGDEMTGVTSMYMSEEMDAGDMIFTEITPIQPTDTSADLFERLGDIGAKLLGKTLNAIRDGTAPRIPQNHADATFAPMLNRDLSPIKWDNGTHAINCKVRALIPWPVATMELNGKTLKIHSVETTDRITGLLPGTVIEESVHGLEVTCNDGTVIVTRLQAPGGRIMPTADYLRGRKK